MILIVNGDRTELADGATLAELVGARLATDKGVAAAVDGAVAPRRTWPDIVLRDGQTVELLTAVQGG
jgi:sulfur carrier protein